MIRIELHTLRHGQNRAVAAKEYSMITKIELVNNDEAAEFVL